MEFSVASVLMYAMVCIAELLVSFSYFTEKYEKRLKTAAIFLLGSIFYIVILFLNLFFDEYMLINIPLFLISTFSISVMSFKIKKIQALSETLCLTSILFITEVVTAFVISSAFDIKINTYQSNLSLFTIVEVISKLLFLLFSKMISTYSDKETSLKISRRYVVLFVYPITIMALILLLFISSVEYNFSQNMFTLIACVGALALFISIGIFIFYQRSIDQENELNELHAELEKEEIDKKYLKIIEQQNKDLHILIHDTKNHLQTINGLANSDDVTNYINSFYNEIEKYTFSTKTKNKILDLLLNKYNSLANANGINFSTDVRVSNLSKCIKDADLSIMLNNLLDNAFEASGKTIEKNVEFSIKQSDDFYIISVINSSMPPKINNNGLISTKRVKDEHGYGTKSIKRYAKKNNGEFDWYYDDKKLEFHSTIIIENKTKNAINYSVK